MASEVFTDPPEDADASDDLLICTECGAAETGFFCRQCGALLRGEELVLCPRCHRVVPSGDYCNQCGQSLTGIALNLRQLALAGDDFMITSATAPASPAPARVPVPSAPPNTFSFSPDESVKLEDPELPDWLEELPKTRAPREVRERIYPTLRPVESTEAPASQSRYLVAVVILLTLALISIVGFAVLLLIRVI
ncbi:MAG TPA: zinc ribbon domain-containing protein [Anaerolineae bacterium]|nr:zinc ribbon domain-containing protein [Anaerolineae bacterium]